MRNAIARALVATILGCACPLYSQLLDPDAADQLAIYARLSRDGKKCVGGSDDPNSRIKECTAALRSDRLPPEAAAWLLLNRGIAWFDTKNYTTAIADYDSALRVKPDARAYNNRGNAYDEQGMPERAIQDYDEALRLKPNYAIAFRNRALVYVKKNELDRAIQDLDQSIRIDPNYADALLDHGETYLKKGEPDRALQNFDHVLRLQPNNSLAVVRRTNAFLDKGDYDLALQEVQQLVRFDPKSSARLQFRGAIKFFRFDFGGAQSDFAQASQLDPKDEHPVIWDYVAKARSGNSAVEGLREKAKVFDSATSSGRLVRLYLGELTPEQVKVSTNVADLKPKERQQCWVNYFLGEYFLIKGKQDDAVALFSAIAQNGPDSACAGHIAYWGARAELKHIVDQPQR